MSQATVSPPMPLEIESAAPKEELFHGEPTHVSVTDQVCNIVEGQVPKWWWPAFGISNALLAMGVFAVVYLISTGVGIWGNNQPVAWSFPIVNFVFWVGIGHAGTLISAILLLFRQKWRTSINRFAEAMTIFAVACAGIFPLIHVGRIWMMWFMVPVPNNNAIYQNFFSPLLWDVFAVSTYATVSLLFWYVGLIPDLATLRDRAKTQTAQFLYGLFAVGWRGSARHWLHYEKAVLLLAGLSTPLVLSVHTIVSFDFAVSVIPGWHATIFPPYFVAGAIFSGFAMVITLMIPIRQLFKLENLVTEAHLNAMSKILIVTGLMVGYAYAIEFFTAWYSGNEYEGYVFLNRAFGPYTWAYWIMVTCNVLVPQVLWYSKFRVSPWILFTVSIFLNIGMWFERFVIVVTSLHRDFLVSSWGNYTPTWVDVIQFIGSFGLFFTLFLLFLRFLPMIAMFEVKAVLAEKEHEGHHGTSTEGAVETTQTEVADNSQATGANGTPVGTGASLSSSGVPPEGVLARFETVGELESAVEKVRAEGYTEVDTYSPYPIHGMEDKLGLPPTRLPMMVLGAGLVGLVLSLSSILYLNLSIYPIIVGGKPHGAVEPLIPVVFEVVILFSALTAVFGMLGLNGLPKYGHPLFVHEGFRRVTTDGLFLFVSGTDKQFDTEKTSALLTDVGGKDTATVEGHPDA